MKSTLRWLIALLTISPTGFSLMAEPAKQLVRAEEPRAEEPRIEETWYRVDLGGQPAGRMMSRETWLGDELTTENELEIAVRRGTTELRLEMASRFVEGRDGTPRHAWSRQLLGPYPMETDYELTASEIVVTTRHGDSLQTERQRMPEVGWLTPGQNEAALRQHLAAGSERFTLRTVDPLVGLTPIDVEWELVERQLPLSLGEGEILVSRWRQKQSITPQMESLIDLDASGRVVRSELPLMGLSMVLTLVPHESVRTLGRAPEVLVSTLIHPDRPIPGARALRRARYELWLDDGTLELLPSVGQQRVERLAPEESGEGGRLRITVDLDADPVPPDQDEKAASYLTPSTFLDFDHPRLVALLARALADSQGRDPAWRAETLRRFVADTLRDKDLETALATASEAAEIRSGDCTEHSMLLSALLRGAGIPARVVSGLVYVDSFAGEHHVFGYHMWSQALIDDRWVDLDASMPTPFDATHLAFAVTALNDDQEALLELSRLAPLIGRVRLRLLDLGEPGGTPGDQAPPG